MDKGVNEHIINQLTVSPKGLLRFCLTPRLSYQPGITSSQPAASPVDARQLVAADTIAACGDLGWRKIYSLLLNLTTHESLIGINSGGSGNRNPNVRGSATW